MNLRNTSNNNLSLQIYNRILSSPAEITLHSFNGKRRFHGFLSRNPQKNIGFLKFFVQEPICLGFLDEKPRKRRKKWIKCSNPSWHVMS